MLPLFTTPWAFLALLAVPALVAIYWLRNRFRPLPVSSLLLWADQKESREGGMRVRRLQTPLLFFLELLAILLLVLAAAGPLAATPDSSRPVVVVLDDSYSMQAGGAASPRNQAPAVLAEELDHSARPGVRFVLAGATAQLLGQPARTTGEALGLLDGWKCRAPAARLDEAVALAAEVGGERALILVVSDHAPAPLPGPGRLQWWALGRVLPNVAFVNAARTSRGGQDRCLLEIANLSAAPQTTPLVVEAGDPAEVVHRATLALAPGEIRRVLLRVAVQTPALHARLGPDALEIDNRVVLLPESQRPVRVAVRIKEASLRTLVEKALQATGRTMPATTAPDLLFADGDEQPLGDSWQVRFLVEKEAEAYLGPFVVEHTHPLTEGLTLRGIVWGAGKTATLPGTPVILAGNIPLLSDAEGASGRHTLSLRLRPDLSTLQDSPQWPILIWNLVQWRAAQGPGLPRANLRLGETAVLNVADRVPTIRVLAPDGLERTVPVHEQRAAFAADDIGMYVIQAGEQRDQCAVNALHRDESDLSHCASGRWGTWTEESVPGTAFQSFSWILLLLAALVLTTHLAQVAANSGRAGGVSPLFVRSQQGADASARHHGDG